MCGIDRKMKVVFVEQRVVAFKVPTNFAEVQ